MPKISKFKVVLIGDQNVGKTSIISRFIHDSFEHTSNPTVGIDFATKTMQVDSETMRMQLWDTAGQQRFRSLIPSYVRDADCCLVVLDVNSPSSFEGIDRWIDFIRQTKGQEGLIVLVANKIDLQREISEDQVKKLAQKNNIIYQQVSAKNSTNINELFRRVSERLVSMRKNAGNEETDGRLKNKNENQPNKIVLKQSNEFKGNAWRCSC